ncbi:uncharacterized protein LY89DRAFT_735289 [Mollisia scopiformis]|uniref:Uncharacterized protein n=1 Tax=Mollisia scopiformis TaxID=149040 RepID=A0A194X509_MOLSC|nr:uncharacterized protein LY89DRAFT_735289 [Mollisia scopiformis]KUJ15154.1 hypothetical protein LY89DRAFT_735289 [Mollisia scopiformis]
MPPFAGAIAQGNQMSKYGSLSHFDSYQNSMNRHPQADYYAMQTSADYKIELNSWKRTSRERKHARSDAEVEKEKIECRDRTKEFPSPYYGTWWKIFYEGIYADEARWRRIREAMGRGACRVVVRWEDWQIEEVGRGHGSLKARSGGMGLGPGSGGFSTRLRGTGQGQPIHRRGQAHSFGVLPPSLGSTIDHGRTEMDDGFDMRKFEDGESWQFEDGF